MFKKLIAAVAASALCSIAQASSATVTLDGWGYLQYGSIQNRSTDGSSIVGFLYSLGEQANGNAIWQNWLSDGNRTRYLNTAPNHYSDNSWALNIAPGDTWNFSGLDIDVIADKNAGTIDSDLDFTGLSLRTAYIEITFDNGYQFSTPLHQTAWDVTQTFQLDQSVVMPVPEPSTYLMFLAGIGGFMLAIRKKK